MASRASDRGSVPPVRDPAAESAQRGKNTPAYIQQLVERATLGTAAGALAIVLSLVSRDSLDAPLRVAFACAFAAIPPCVAGYLSRELVVDPRRLSRRFELSRNVLLAASVGGVALVAVALAALLSHALSLHIWPGGVVCGFLWIVVPPCYAIGIFGRYLETHPTNSGPEAGLTNRRGEYPPTGDTGSAVAPIRTKLRRNSQR